MRKISLAALYTLLAVLGGVGFARPAGAHGADGEMTVITAEPAGPLSVRLEVGLLYSNDQEPAVDATVTVTGAGPDGNTLDATPLPRGEGAKYGATIDGLANGPWTFTFTSVEPTAEATADVEVLVSQSVSTSTPGATTTSPSTTIAPEDIDDPTDTPTTLVETTDAAETSSEDDNTPAALAVLTIASVGIIIGVGLYLRSRRTFEGPPTDS